MSGPTVSRALERRRSGDAASGTSDPSEETLGEFSHASAPRFTCANSEENTRYPFTATEGLDKRVGHTRTLSDAR